MRNFLPLLGKELRALFYSPIAYIIIAAAGLISLPLFDALR